MSIRKAIKKVTPALLQTRGLGILEESLEFDGHSIVLRSLTDMEWAAAHSAAFDVLNGSDSDTSQSDVLFTAHMHLEALSRSICDLDGESLRDVDFIEAVIDDTTVQLERHDFLLKFVLPTWSQSFIGAVWDCYLGLLERTSVYARQSIRLTVDNETVVERYQRLLTELRQLEGQCPVEVVDRVLDGSGYMRTEMYTAQRLQEVSAVPQVSVPQVSVPQVSVPQVSVPQVSVPQVSVPQVSVPQVSVPPVPTIEGRQSIPARLAQRQAELASLEALPIEDASPSITDTGRPVQTLFKSEPRVTSFQDSPNVKLNPRFQPKR